MRLLTIAATTTTSYTVDVEVPDDFDTDDSKAVLLLIEENADYREEMESDTYIDGIDLDEPVEENN